MSVIIIPSTLSKTIKNKHLLFDASFFIDFKDHETEFLGFIKQIRKLNCVPVTINQVAIEFVKGSKSEEDMQERLSLINSCVDYFLPVIPSVYDEQIYKQIVKYDRRGASASMTDLILGVLAKNHQKEMCYIWC